MLREVWKFHIRGEKYYLLLIFRNKKVPYNISIELLSD